MSQDKERGERALSIEGLWELFGRNTRLVVVTILAFVIGSFVVLALRAPSYRARATLILDEQSAGAGILGELAMLGKAPVASSQIEILRARSTAAETVAWPTLPRDAAGAPEERERHLGLTTLVEDPLLKPLDGLVFGLEPEGKLPARLRARVECADEFDDLRELDVEFLAADRVRIEGRGLTQGGDALEVTLDVQPIEYEGCRLWLEPEGDLSGRKFGVVRVTREEAIARVMQATRARETERNSGVIELTFDDSDPRRAAETANALCRNYLARNEARGERRASQTVRFIDESLSAQTQLLQEAEGEVVRLQRDNPRAIDIGKSAEALIEQLSQLEVRRMQLALSSVSVRHALDLLASGDVDALSRLAVDLADPISATFLEGIAKLSAEHALQERSDTGAFKTLLQQRALELEAQIDATGIDVRALESALAALAAGDLDALARIGGGPPTAHDPLLEGDLTELSELERRRGQMQLELTPEHPDRVALERQLAATRERIRALFSARLEGRLTQAAEQTRLLESYRERAVAYPAGERARIESALAGLRARTATHLTSRLAGLGQDEAALQAEIARVESSLGTLPEDERAIADPLRRMTAYSETVKFLLTKRQEAAITKASTVASAEFIDTASPAVERSGPSIALHLLFGLLLGTLAALGCACAWEALARGVFTSAELETATGLPVLGMIPDFRRGRYKVRGVGRYFVPLREDPEGTAAEAYRSLRTNLKFVSSGDKELRVIAATSCTQGEGKSSTNIALAMSFAMSGRRVILVDCDMRVPSVATYLGLPPGPGLSEVLQTGGAWRDAVQVGVVERLDVLCAGAHPASPGDLLDSAAFRGLIDELKDAYDLVVCDVPPALAVSDFEAVAAQVDGVIVVVRSNKLAARVITNSLQRLRRSGAPIVGTVLNGVGASLANGRYGHEYEYGYGPRGLDRKRAAG